MSNSYIEQKSNSVKSKISRMSQTIKNSGKASNLTLARVSQIQKNSSC